jgi:hypothetical protein
MPTVREIIASGYRMAGVKDAAASLTALDATVGLELLQEFYDGITNGLLGRFNDVIVTEDYTVKEFDRVLSDNGATDITITFPETVTDDDTGEERPVKDLTLVLVSDVDTVLRRAYLYDSHYGGWNRLDSLTLDDFAPLSLRFAAGLRAMIAIKRQAEDGFTPSPMHARAAAMMNLALATRYDSAAEPVSNTYF